MNPSDLHLYRCADAAIRASLADDLTKLAGQWDRAEYNSLRHTLQAMRQRLDTIEKAIPPLPESTREQLAAADTPDNPRA